MFRSVFLSFCFLSVFLVVHAACAPVRAQDTAEGPRSFEIMPYVVGPLSFQSGKTRIDLWGVESARGDALVFDARARRVLEKLAGQNKIRCDLRARTGDVVKASCSANGQDLGLAMIQEGYAIADRKDLRNTRFESLYKEAEVSADIAGMGMWGLGESGSKLDEMSGDTVLLLGVILLIVTIGALLIISIIIMRGFQKVIEAQNQNMDMMGRERSLRDKERGIVATMIDSELKANKSKLEAYLVVYEEMLKNLQDPGRSPKYKKAGDIVQAQPALERSVFDRNTDKMGVLGDRLSSEVIHFYARIKSKPDYINIEPNAPQDEVVAIVNKAIKGARRMDELAERLIKRFKDSGYASSSD